ncbi:hypothetical protein L7F22_010915 [Adiantum nelumboides]|nr:hypothetical protein [Adiantum nelumboides]
MAILCGGSSWNSSLTQLPTRRAQIKAEADRLFVIPALTRRRSSSSLHCTDPYKSTPVSPSQPQEGIATVEDKVDKKGKEAEDSSIEVFLGKLFRGRLWFFILVFLLTAFGAGYGYLVFTFADVADVPILGVTR